ncbi:MAG: urease accessory protein UreH [Acidobacteria bacterium]|nr:urease accessory protein UreH [Acidobacteriota bacterium]MCA1636978.1 urease accessory protein UreH [Acidobacteriota bacterium]
MSEVLLLMFSTSTATVLSLGFFLGLKHATEADHLAAVSTIVTERRSLFSSALVGGLWGLGHTISLFVAGIFVLLLNFQISERTERMLEFGVGVMLVFLGLNVLRKIIQGGTLHFHSHEHGGHKHIHPHLHEHGQEDEPHSHHGFSFSPRSLIIGMVHGLAGSAALMLLVIPTINSTAMGLLYIVIFGVGSIGGMMLMSFLVSLPFQITALRFNRFNLLLQCIAGLFSVALGLLIIYEKGITEGLLG